MRVLVRVDVGREVLESERLRVVQVGLEVRVDRRAVDLGRHDVRQRRGEGVVERVGPGAHREEEAAALDVRAQRLGDGELELRDRRVAVCPRRRLGEALLLLVPRLPRVLAVELAVLPRKVLVVEVHPVELAQAATEDVVVVDLLVRHLGVGEREEHGVVPRQRLRRRVDGDAGDLFEAHGRRVGRPRLGLLDEGRPVGRLERDAADAQLVGERRIVRPDEGAAADVQQPVHLHPVLERPVDGAVRLQMVRLRLVHRDQDGLRADGRDEEQGEEKETHQGRKCS